MFTTGFPVRTVARVSLLISSDVHHIVFTVLSCEEPKILENSKEYLPVFCLLIRVLLAQQFTYITHLFGKQIDSLIGFLMALAGFVSASLVLESGGPRHCRDGGRFLPEGKSFGKEGWVFFSTYLHMLLSYKGNRRPSW